MDAEARALCSATAAWLGANRVLGPWCLALAIGVVAMLVLAGRGAPLLQAGLAGLLLVLAGGERYFALRLQFDQALFAALARGEIAHLPALDASLQALHLRRAGPGPLRSLESRVAGTCTLVRWHRGVVVLQSLLGLSVLAWQISIRSAT